jgi:hypothetical protein
LNGLHLATLLTERQDPFSAPYFFSASIEYSEQEGTNLQLPGRTGEIRYLYNLTIAISSTFIRKSGKYFGYNPVYVSEIRVRGSGPCDDHDVILKRHLSQPSSHGLPQATFYPVSRHCVTCFSADGKSEPAEVEPARQNVNHEVLGGISAAGLKDPFKIPFFDKGIE